MEYMVFDTEQIAIDAEQAIETIGGLPITGVNALTGDPEPEKQKTEKWDIPRQRLDGKWILARLPLNFREQYAEHEAGFDASYPHVIEEYSADWFPAVEE